ncbi:13721_t:CDS:2 [Funneliformis mosseae]|uniref:13721_t:CDS:1 n=1 Tax=Funneliformis mosseae TaxID=27381 RepID=A0A9N9GMX1_FUNMO|nr:13721_t:CDS:2 [Funneliformis mosseae]
MNFNALVDQTAERNKSRTLKSRSNLKEYILIFHDAHIRRFTNDSVILIVGANLNGTRAYGTVGYFVKLDGFSVLVNIAKLEDIRKGIAQNIMLLHNASEPEVVGISFVELVLQENIMLKFFVNIFAILMGDAE